MSFWYDVKKKKYSSDANGSWFRAYAEKLVGLLRKECEQKFAEEAELRLVGDGTIRKEIAANNQRFEDLPISNMSGKRVETFKDLSETAKNGATVIADKRERTFDDGMVMEGNVACGEYSVAAGENNTALSDNSSAIGKNNFAGTRLFNIIAIDVETKQFTLSSVTGLEIGMEYSCHIGHAYGHYGKITAVDTVNNVVTVDKIPSTYSLTDSHIFWIAGRSDLGDVIAGEGANATGIENISQMDCTHTGGKGNLASGKYGFAHGIDNIAGNWASVAFGHGSEALGLTSFVLGRYSSTRGTGAFAANSYNQANGTDSFVSGWNNIANGEFQSVRGKANVIDDNNKYVDIVGNGTDDQNRSNAYTLDWDGNAWFAGRIKAGIDKREVAFDSDIMALQVQLDSFDTVGSRMGMTGGYTFTSGDHNEASGYCAFATGFRNKAIGTQSQAMGRLSVAKGDYQSVRGKANVIDNNNKYVDIVGNGTDDQNRSNAYTLDWDGNAWFAGDVSITDANGAIISLLAKIAELENNIVTLATQNEELDARISALESIGIAEEGEY